MSKQIVNNQFQAHTQTNIKEIEENRSPKLYRLRCNLNKSKKTTTNNKIFLSHLTQFYVALIIKQNEISIALFRFQRLNQVCFVFLLKKQTLILKWFDRKLHDILSIIPHKLQIFNTPGKQQLQQQPKWRKKYKCSTTFIKMILILKVRINCWFYLRYDL